MNVAFTQLNTVSSYHYEPPPSYICQCQHFMSNLLQGMVRQTLRHLQFSFLLLFILLWQSDTSCKICLLFRPAFDLGCVKEEATLMQCDRAIY